MLERVSLGVQLMVVMFKVAVFWGEKELKSLRMFAFLPGSKQLTDRQILCALLTLFSLFLKALGMFKGICQL